VAMVLISAETLYSPLDSGVSLLSLGFLNWLWLIIPVLVVLGYVWAKLSYENYKYELTDDSFRKELGVIYKKYVSIPYERIQNIDIYRGILDRLLGLSNLHVQTAGASSAMNYRGMWRGGAEGKLPGLSKEVAEQLRDELVKRSQGAKGKGL